MRISYIGKFDRLYDEEYIARGFEALGHEVLRLKSSEQPRRTFQQIEAYKPDFLLYGKLNYGVDTVHFLEAIKKIGVPTVCWLFDIYWDYVREHQIKTNLIFKSNHVCTTDGGHDEKWQNEGINHHLVRQGIVNEQCVLLPFEKRKYDVVFVGSHNGAFMERTSQMITLETFYNFKWFGKKDTHEVREMELNKLYAHSAIVVGDSFPSPRYWSNRVVETLGRGGFLIHAEVDGLKEEYPDIVTYRRGDTDDLRKKIDYYLIHENERREIVKKNFALVKEKYTIDKKCAELIKAIHE